MAELRLFAPEGVHETLAFLDACAREGVVAGVVDPALTISDAGTADSPHRPALALWTSGSTGAPRGVLFGAERLRHAASTIAASIDLRGTVGIALPLHYSYALVGQALAGRAAGCDLVDLRGAPDLAAALHAARIEVFSGVPALLRQLVEAIEDGAPAPPLHTVCSAGAPLSGALARRIRAALPDAVLWNQYGTTELGPRLAAIPHHDPAFVAALAEGRDPPAGRLLPGAEARVVDGHLEARTPWQALGSLDVLVPDDWQRTGDLGSLDGDLVTVHGRADHVLLVGGEKVHPAAIERVLRLHVEDAGVVGRPHRRLGQVPVAFVVGDPDAERDLWATLRAELPPRARQVTITWLDALPRLSSGKLDRSALQ